MCALFGPSAAGGAYIPAFCDIVVMVAGNRPLETKTGPMYIFGEIESGNRHGAMVVSVVLLAASLGVLVVLNRLQRRGAERAQ